MDLIDINFYALGVFLISYFLSRIIHFDLYFLFGSVLIFLPGAMILRIFPSLKKDFGLFGKISLSFFLSFSLMCLLELVLVPKIGLNESGQIIIVLSINFLGSLCCLIFCKPISLRSLYQTIKSEASHYNRNDLIVLAIPFLVLSITYLINPFAQNADGYLTAFKDSLLNNKVLLPSRELFVSTLAFVKYLTGFNYLIVYRLFFIFLFYISTFFLFDYAVLHIKSKKLAYIGYLLLLSAPVMITELNIIRPQIAMMAYTLPVLILSILSMEKRKIEYGLLAFIFSIISVKFHELSIGLILISLIAIFYNLYLLFFIAKKLNYKHALLGLIIIFHYLFIFPFGSYFSDVKRIISYALALFPGFHFRWWFLSNYSTVTSFNLSWTGIGVVYYYLFNGILAILFLAFIIYIFRKKITFSWVKIIIPLLYIIIFFIAAEILPRFGFYFYPNRAWVHLIYGFVILAVLIFSFLKITRKDEKLLILPFSIIVAIGILGTFYVGSNNISEVFWQEKAAANFIKTTSKNSLFISSQDNQSLVIFEGDRNFLWVDTKDKALDQNSFNTIVDEGLKKGEQDGKIAPTPNIYFIYSYRKLNGLVSKRNYLLSLYDEANAKTYQQFSFDKVYEDKNVLILKLK